MINVNGSNGGTPNGTHYEVGISINKGHMVVNVELENSQDKPLQLLFGLAQAMELRDAIEKAVWTLSP